MKKFCQRLNAWRRANLFITAKELLKLHSYYLDRSADLRRAHAAELSKVQHDILERESAVFQRELDVIHAEVEKRSGDTATFTLSVSNYILLHRVNGSLDTEICRSICRKIVDGLRWAAEQNRNYPTGRYIPTGKLK